MHRRRRRLRIWHREHRRRCNSQSTGVAEARRHEHRKAADHRAIHVFFQTHLATSEATKIDPATVAGSGKDSTPTAAPHGHPDVQSGGQACVGQTEAEYDQQQMECPSTPGMKYRHYSPRAPLILFNLQDGNADEDATAIRARVIEFAEKNYPGMSIGIALACQHSTDQTGGRSMCTTPLLWTWQTNRPRQQSCMNRPTQKR